MWAPRTVLEVEGKVRINFRSARGVGPSRNTGSADLLTNRIVLNRARRFLRLRPFCTRIRMPSDLNNRVNGWSYEWCRMRILNYLGPPKGVPSAVLTHACNT